MAAVSLSEAQIAKVKKYFKQSGMTNNRTIGFAGDALFNQAAIELEEHCRSIQNSETLDEITDILDKLDTLYEAKFNSHTRMLANQIGDIRLDPHEEHRIEGLCDDLKSELAGLLRLEHLLPCNGGISQVPQY